MTMEVVTIILIIVAAIAGYLFGIFDSRVTGTIFKKTEVPKPAEEPAHAEPKWPGEHTVLRFSIDKALKWHLELDGTRLEKPNEINPEQRQRAINLVMQMRPGLDGKSVPAAPAVFIPAPPAPSLELPNPPTPVLMPVADSDSLKINGLRGFSSLVLKADKTKVEKPPVSIVTMIDEVLQAKLPGTPLKEKSIRLEDGPMGSVLVHVGSQSYNGIDAVPEAEIRDMIRAAIVDWEKK
jgi:hypothetical protein